MRGSKNQNTIINTNHITEKVRKTNGRIYATAGHRPSGGGLYLKCNYYRFEEKYMAAKSSLNVPIQLQTVNVVAV